MLPGVSPNSGYPTSTPVHDTLTPSAAPAPAADLSTCGFSEDERRTEDGGRNSGRNRWPRQETLYLLKIRPDMDVVFRDSSLKGPLWDEVSRKLAKLGFHRSAKKCKKKFKNAYKYHKRIKEGQSSKADGKTYNFFEQLEALEANGGNSQPSVPLPPPPSVVSKPPMPSIATPAVDPISVAALMMNVNNEGRFPFSQLSMSSSSSTSSDDKPVEKLGNRKQKWKEFLGG